MDILEAMNKLERYKTYKIRHQIPGVQRYARQSVMRYMGYVLHTGEFQFQFSARPAAGTQHLLASHIQAIELVPDHYIHYVNQRAPKGS